MEFAAEVLGKTPETLADLLAGFTPDDATRIRENLAEWRADASAGREML